MRSDVLLYDKVYSILKNRIESGLLPDGSRLPSRADMCREFGISGKTARRVIALLAQSGLISTNQRKRAVVKATAEDCKILYTLKKAKATYADEILKSGVLLCYPLVATGVEKCFPDDLEIPERIFASMKPEHPEGFWKLSNRIWRFFISRNENDISLRAVDSLGLSDIDPLNGTIDVRERYLRALGEFLDRVKKGLDISTVHFEDLSYLYGFASGQKNPTFMVSPDSPLFIGSKAVERSFSISEIRYSAVYMDILGLIAKKQYLPGSRLPSHRELCRIYGVSVDTTMKAIGVLNAWGVVTSKRGSGIFVAKDLEGLKKITISPDLIAFHVRRYLDSLELLSQTIEGVAAHAAGNVKLTEAQHLIEEVVDLWENGYLYLKSPALLLQFIFAHIEYKSLKTIYSVLLKNYHIGRSIPKLVTGSKTPLVCEINRQCLAAVEVLKDGDSYTFGKKCAELFRYIHRLVIVECSKFGYLNPAMKVYDGSSLWKVNYE